MLDHLRRQFADNFLQARERSGMTQAALGRKINMARGDVSKYECGRSLPRLSTMIRLSRGLGCPLEDLMIGMGPEDMAKVMGELEPWTGHDGAAIYVDAIEELEKKRAARAARGTAGKKKAPAKKTPAKKAAANKKAPAKKTAAKKAPVRKAAAAKTPATKPVEKAPTQAGSAEGAPVDEVSTGAGGANSRNDAAPPEVDATA
jgi:transcriptional regulator with XRE-family HTH domain